MSTNESIVHAVQKLAPAELVDSRRWFAEYGLERCWEVEAPLEIPRPEVWSDHRDDAHEIPAEKPAQPRADDQPPPPDRC